MTNWIKRLFHLHEYEVIDQYKVEINEGWGIKWHRQTIIQRCKHCGKIKVDKIRL